MASIFTNYVSGWTDARGMSSPQRMQNMGLMGEEAIKLQKALVPLPTPKMGPDKEIITWGMGNQSGACGVGNLHSFNIFNLNTVPKVDAAFYEREYTKETLHNLSGGCGFLSAGFIDTDSCRKMFQYLRDNFTLLYQSPVRFNNNSGNNFFFAVFDTGEKKKSPKFYGRDGAGFKDGVTW